MERLTQKDFDFCAEYCTIHFACGYFKHLVPTMCDDAAIYEKLRDYENAEEQGLLVRLPCKVGDTVYTESNIKGLISSFSAPDETWIFENREEFGKTVFLIREEAEAALAKEG